MNLVIKTLSFISKDDSYKDDVIKLLREKIISNIFSFRGHKTLKLRSKFILKNLIFFQFKIKRLKIRV